MTPTVQDTTTGSLLDEDVIAQMLARNTPTWWAWVLGVSEKTVHRLQSRTYVATPVLQRLVALCLANPEAAERVARLPPVSAADLENLRARTELDRARFARFLAISGHEYNKLVSDPALLAARKRSWHLLARWLTDIID